MADRHEVVGRCEIAAARGVRHGMTLAHARALLRREPIEELFEPEREARSLVALATWCLRFTPIVAPDPPDGLLLEIGGCTRLFRGEARLLGLIHASMTRFGFRARFGVAGTIGAAWAVARSGEREISRVPDGGEREAMEPLPVEMLRVERDAIDALHEVNLRRIGEVMDLPREEIAMRFGGGLLRRIDQALGRADERIEPLRPTEPLTVEQAFDGPVTDRETIEIVVRRLVGAIAHTLETREAGATEVRVRFEPAEGAGVERSIRLGRPSRDERHLWTLLRPGVERLSLRAGIERIEMKVEREGRLRHRQRAWRGTMEIEEADVSAAERGGAESRALGEFVDTLVSRCGPGGVRCVRLIESHVPERAFRYPTVEDAEPARGRRATDPPCAGAPARPSYLLREPEPIRMLALAPDGPPARMEWRGRSFELIGAVGPERIAPAWWREEREVRFRRTRDYFRVQTAEGVWMWVYRFPRQGGWFLHGWWA